jgi:hypothetical protein
VSTPASHRKGGDRHAAAGLHARLSLRRLPTRLLLDQPAPTRRGRHGATGLAPTVTLSHPASVRGVLYSAEAFSPPGERLGAGTLGRPATHLVNLALGVVLVGGLKGEQFRHGKRLKCCQDVSSCHALSLATYRIAEV